MFGTKDIEGLIVLPVTEFPTHGHWLAGQGVTICLTLAGKLQSQTKQLFGRLRLLTRLTLVVKYTDHAAKKPSQNNVKLTIPHICHFFCTPLHF